MDFSNPMSPGNLLNPGNPMNLVNPASPWCYSVGVCGDLSAEPQTTQEVVQLPKAKPGEITVGDAFAAWVLLVALVVVGVIVWDRLKNR